MRPNRYFQIRKSKGLILSLLLGLQIYLCIFFRLPTCRSWAWHQVKIYSHSPFNWSVRIINTRSKELSMCWQNFPFKAKIWTFIRRNFLSLYALFFSKITRFNENVIKNIRIFASKNQQISQIKISALECFDFLMSGDVKNGTLSIMKHKIPWD